MLVAAPPSTPPTPAKTFSVSPSRLKVGDEELLLPRGCKIRVDWTLKSPKMELKNQTDGETLAWHLSEVSKVIFVTAPGEEVCMRWHLDTDTPEGKGGGGSAEEDRPLAAAVRRGALRRGWKVVYLQRQDAEKARTSLLAWSATKVPSLEVTDEVPPASPPLAAHRAVEAAIVAAGLAATVRLGIAVATTAQASAVLADLRSAGRRPVVASPCAAGGGWVLGVGSGAAWSQCPGSQQHMRSPAAAEAHPRARGCPLGPQGEPRPLALPLRGHGGAAGLRGPPKVADSSAR